MENRIKIFNCDDDKFKEIIAKSRSYRNVVRLILNDELLDDSIIARISTRHKNDILKKIKKLELDISHFKRIEYISPNKVDLTKILVENKHYNSCKLKKLLYREELKEEKCEKCGVGSIWNGGLLAHQLDHINGNNKDNRIENIRILCAICHSQTDTYCTGQRGTYVSSARQKIFNCEDDKFKEYVAKSKNYENLVRLIFKDELLDFKIIMRITYSYKNDILKKIKKLELDISHFKKNNNKKLDLNKLLNENKKYSSCKLKNILYREQIKQEKCEKCSIDPEYNGIPFAMHLDHINGNNKDNRIENLRILCPNCHSQTTTFCTGQLFKDTSRPSKEKLLEDIKQFKTLIMIAEKNNVCQKTIVSWIKAEGLYEIYEEIYKSSIESKKEHKCSKCNKEVTNKNTSELCKDCKTKRPSKEQLLNDLKEFKTIIAIGEKYGVSDNGVKKWIKKYEITNFKSILKNLEKI